MRSHRELQQELLQVRVNPTNVSQWNALIAVKDRARQLLTDAIQTYEFNVQAVLYSIGISGMPQTIALPKDVTRVIDVQITANTQGTYHRRSVNAFRLIATPSTNLLRLDEALNIWALNAPPQFWLEIQYAKSSRSLVLPPDVALIGSVSNTAGGITVSGGRPIDRWPVPGYLEITPVLTSAAAYTDNREVVYYGFVSPTGFSGFVRGIEGEAQDWSGGNVSMVLPAPNEAIPVWMRAAQAQLYDALVSDRAFYDQYNAIASDQASPPERLIGLARTFEDKADRVFKRTRKLPQPSHHPIRRFRR